MIGVYPGGKGGNGGSDVQGSGGGAGGVDSHPSANYNGGRGGHAGPTGFSGGGGGGGAASVVTLNSTLIVVAGGAGGGGGMGGSANSGQPGSNSVASNGTTNGGNGANSSGDGGGGGGGGGGQLGSAGGSTYIVGSERAGNGGRRGNNFHTGATSVTGNGRVARTSAGQVVISYNVVLPVRYLSFSSSVNQHTVLLKWSTATEQHSSNFEVQRSSNNSEWQNIGVVSAAGNSTNTIFYSFTDDEPVNGTNYYRLVQHDLDGKRNISKTITASYSNTNGLHKIFPNPVVNGILNISLTKDAAVYLYSSSGKNLLHKKLPAGKHQIDVSNYAKGNYFIKINNQTERFVIQ